MGKSNSNLSIGLKTAAAHLSNRLRSALAMRWPGCSSPVVMQMCRDQADGSWATWPASVGAHALGHEAWPNAHARVAGATTRMLRSPERAVRLPGQRRTRQRELGTVNIGRSSSSGLSMVLGWHRAVQGRGGIEDGLTGGSCSGKHMAGGSNNDRRWHGADSLELRR
jgi:hypothetical protein